MAMLWALMAGIKAKLIKLKAQIIEFKDDMVVIFSRFNPMVIKIILAIIIIIGVIAFCLALPFALFGVDDAKSILFYFRIKLMNKFVSLHPILSHTIIAIGVLIFDFIVFFTAFGISYIYERYKELKKNKKKK